MHIYKLLHKQDVGAGMHSITQGLLGGEKGGESILFMVMAASYTKKKRNGSTAACVHTFSPSKIYFRNSAKLKFRKCETQDRLSKKGQYKENDYRNFFII